MSIEIAALQAAVVEKEGRMRERLRELVEVESPSEDARL